MLSNAYFLAKFRFDTAENEPAKNLQNFPNTLRTAGCARMLHRWLGLLLAVTAEEPGVSDRCTCDKIKNFGHLESLTT